MGIAQTIGQRIRNYRLQNKLSQEELAERAGCHHTYIGQSTPPSSATNTPVVSTILTVPT